MTNEQIKQAYVVGKAAKGVLRYRYLQKQAMMKRADEKQQPNSGFKDPLGGYTLPATIGMGTGAILGALIQAARGKDILNGLLVGGGLGGLGGAGYQAYSSGDYKNLFPSNDTATPDSKSAPEGKPT